MKVKDIQNIFHVELDVLYGEEEVNSFFFILIAHYNNITRIQLAVNPDMVIDDYENILNALQLLKKQKPIQYIIGETEFYGLPFKVNENVLIPRPETEELVDWVLKEVDNNKPITILDIGTGSGCIAISLAKNLTNAKVYALDVSAKAIKIAKRNAELNKVTVKFIEADILKIKNEGFMADVKFDIIVSNPPYVRVQEKALMKANVLDNEPHLALFVEDENPLLFYIAISNFASSNLNDNGQLYFEINEYLGNDMIGLLSQNHFQKIKLKQDIFKKDRMIKGVKA
ncbi:peptide chain release factor N(5)-glutamine methyltransferase [Algibacter marinivivus]|uniref:Release factor glutamine methyltransferase n=1 Tax=Algibacter marinivivus TaxID=2100723 RepID=A0A2U2X324_9FLAO|nr:peptide chain release factor N(5)-glutamine methyltransferase [Algibacter marinivivus]PWH82186.1 peptide chain release factor N(5)-glutamine methyltransferase [Algibacter marinivivus]